MTEFDPDITPPAAWFSDDPEEMRDAWRVGLLEDHAQGTDDPVMAAEWLAEADELRERWNQPRRRFESVPDIIAELQAISADGGELDIGDPGAVSDLADRASRAAIELQEFAIDLESATED